MLKIVSVCAGVILAAATLSTSADARNGHGGKGGSVGGFKGASVGGYRGNVSGFRGPTMSGARYATAPRAGMYRSGVGSGRVYGGSNYGGGYASGYGYRYPYRRHGYGYGYWPWAVGAGLAVAATGAYYGGDYGYGYDDCVQWRPDWGWVNVCQYPYGGYYPY